MKVRLTNKVSSYSIDGISYKPGDIFELEPSKFIASYMVDLTPITEAVVEEVVLLDNPKPKTRVRKPKPVEEPVVEEVEEESGLTELFEPQD